MDEAGRRALDAVRAAAVPVAGHGTDHDALLEMVGGARGAAGGGHARLREQFDAVIHVDETRAVEPLGITEVWREGEVPETFPSGV